MLGDDEEGGNLWASVHLYTFEAHPGASTAAELNKVRFQLTHFSRPRLTHVVVSIVLEDDIVCVTENCT
jgi:hypothetical protein